MSVAARLRTSNGVSITSIKIKIQNSLNNNRTSNQRPCPVSECQPIGRRRRRLQAGPVSRLQSRLGRTPDWTLTDFQVESSFKAGQVRTCLNQSADWDEFRQFSTTIAEVCQLRLIRWASGERMSSIDIVGPRQRSGMRRCVQGCRVTWQCAGPLLDPPTTWPRSAPPPSIDPPLRQSPSFFYDIWFH